MCTCVPTRRLKASDQRSFATGGMYLSRSANATYVYVRGVWCGVVDCGSEGCEHTKTHRHTHACTHLQELPLQAPPVIGGQARVIVPQRVYPAPQHAVVPIRQALHPFKPRQGLFRVVARGDVVAQRDVEDIVARSLGPRQPGPVGRPLHVPLRPVARLDLFGRGVEGVGGGGGGGAID